MKRFIALAAMLLVSAGVSSGEAAPPVSYHLDFESMDFMADDWVEKTGLKTIEERKLELVDGKFGKALFCGAVPLKYDDDNMSGLDLDMITAVIFNVAYARSKGRGYDEPFIWGAGRLHPGHGALSFWTKGSSKPAAKDARTILFEQTTTSWGRKERQLIEIELFPDRTITAWVEDARYVQHAIASGPVWKDGEWNHVVFMWDRARGISLWINGREAASSMGSDAWWENQRLGIFHLPFARAAYDEFYIFDRTLDEREVRALYTKNEPPEKAEGDAPADDDAVRRLKKAWSTDTSSLPVARPEEGRELSFTQVTPERVHDGGIAGWWIADGRYELAWPHEYSVFTIIPGDVDFHAEKADVLPPAGSSVNYITFEGNLDGVSVHRGDREGVFDDAPSLVVPETTGFFYGALVPGLGDGELRVPFTKSYGTPPGFESDVLRLPLSGDLRIHEMGLFDVHGRPAASEPGDRTMYLNTVPPSLTGTRYPVALDALLAPPDRAALALTTAPQPDDGGTVTLRPMTRVNLMTEPFTGKTAYRTVTLDLPVVSPTEDNVVAIRVLNPAVPSQTWSHAEARLSGFTGESPRRLRIALSFDPVYVVEGDRLWIELFATDGLTIDPHHDGAAATVTLTPETDRVRAETAFSWKTMRPNIMTYGRTFEYIPWMWDKQMPSVDAPTSFGGMFDVAYPWQAVLKVNPGDRLANIYRGFGTGEYQRSGSPADMASVPHKTFDAPGNAPDWAVYFRDFQRYRERIVTWWREHQRPDGQAGGGWNDDTLVFSRTFADLLAGDSPDALALYNNVFDGFAKTNYFKDGYCRIWPIDRLHNGDFVRERYKSLIYNLGDPRSAVWAMEEAWHWGKPDRTPHTYGDGRGFLFGRDVLDWYWGRRKADTPYELTNRDEIVSTLRTAADVHDETTLWRYTEAWVHTDDQRPYGINIMENVLLGGWSGSPKPDDANITIAVGVGWPDGCGPEVARLVTRSANDGFAVDIYSFLAWEQDITTRFYRLEPGTYTVTLTADPDGDGEYDAVILSDEREFGRFDTLTLALPSRTPLHLDVSQTAKAPDPGDLPDLAVSDHYVTVDGFDVTVTVHNIGSAPSGAYTVSLLTPGGVELQRVRMSPLADATDYVPKSAAVTFTNVPDPDDFIVRVDTDDAVREIFEENNTVRYTR